MATLEMLALKKTDPITQRKLNAVKKFLTSEKDPHDGAILVVEPEVASKRIHKWRHLMPRVRPFYAVKANPDPRVIESLIRCGSGFDCASKKEIDLVLQMGAQVKDVVFSHPAKIDSHVSHAAQKGVNLLVFDSLEEVKKMVQLHPNCEAVLRITIGNQKSLIQYNEKYGADSSEIPELMRACKDLGVNLVGIHFHVGSTGNNSQAFTDALSKTAELFKMAASMGHEMRLVDIGGGFPGLDDEDPGIEVYAEAINEGLRMYFPDLAVEVIAEPGRFVACRTTGTLLKIVNKRVKRETEDQIVAHYFFNDGIYGNLHYLRYFPRGDVVFFVKSPVDASVTTRSVLWGASGPSNDFFGKGVQWPELGDGVFFDDTGAYGASVASNFNGYGKDMTKFIYI